MLKDAAFRARLDEVFTVMHGLYEAVIKRGVSEGVFARGEATGLAHTVLALVTGMGSCSALDPEGRLRVRPEDVAENVLRMLRPIPVGLTDFSTASAGAN